MNEDETLDHLKQTLDSECLQAGEVARERRIFVDINSDCLEKAASTLHDMGFTHLSMITGLEVDEKIELIYHLINGGIHLGLRFRLPLDDPVVPTLTTLIPGASLYEREIFDILGVKFEGHPNLTRLILPDKWDESTPPMRKKQSGQKKPLDVTPRKRRQRKGK
jgi:NADH:ubiquinone oxidoreductase subunit C